MKARSSTLALCSVTVLLALMLAACDLTQMGIGRRPPPSASSTATLGLPVTPSAQQVTPTGTVQATMVRTSPTATSTPTPSPSETPTPTTPEHTPTAVWTATPTATPVKVLAMIVTPGTLTLSAGDSACFNVSALANWDGQTLPMWSVHGLPAGASADFKGQTAGNPTSGCLQVHIPCSIAEGEYPVQVMAIVPGKVWTAQVTLTIASCEEFEPGVYTKVMDGLITVIVAGKPDFIDGLAVPLQVCCSAQPRKLRVTIESATSEAGTPLVQPPRFYLFYSLVRPAPDFVDAHSAVSRNVKPDYVRSSGWSLEGTATPGLYLLVFEHDSYADVVNPRQPEDVPDSVTYRLEMVDVPCQ